MNHNGCASLIYETKPHGKVSFLRLNYIGKSQK